MLYELCSRGEESLSNLRNFTNEVVSDSDLKICDRKAYIINKYRYDEEILNYEENMIGKAILGTQSLDQNNHRNLAVNYDSVGFSEKDIKFLTIFENMNSGILHLHTLKFI